MTKREQQILRWIEQDPMLSQEEIARRAGITRSSVAVHISSLIKQGHIKGRGYLLSDGCYGVVVGGINIDICGKSDAPLVDGDSNPGRVTMSLGGVGRNIAHNMSLLGVDVRMLTAMGDDLYAQKITDSCRELHIDISHALRVPGGATSTYLFISDEGGEMALAVSDMGICGEISPAYLANNLPLLQNASVVVADANLPVESLQYLVRNCKSPIFVDPVSTVKAEKLHGLLDGIHTLKPNRIEAELLSGVAIHDDESLRRAAQTLLDAGLQQVFISLGSDGVLAADHEQMEKIPCCRADVRNSTGAGDAFMAALVQSYLEGRSTRESARFASAAAAIAVEGVETINPVLSTETVQSRLSL